MKHERDKNKSNQASIYGIPILVKDNTNVEGMPTTAGTHLLKIILLLTHL
jgi:amidase